MVFNDGLGGMSVCSEIDDICNSDVNSFPLTSKARRVNMALDRFMTLAFQSDGRWAFDDMTRANAPIETINLVSGQQAYRLDSFTSEIINILRFELTDSQGRGTKLKRLNRDEMQQWGNEALTEYKKATNPSTNSVPDEYDLVGNYIYLYPIPGYNSTGGLKVYMERNKLEMVATYTTTPLGIPSIFHEYICRYASLQHLIEMGRPSKNDIAAQIRIDEDAILHYFANREKGIKKGLRVNPERRP